jgi:hypothetical protein
MMDDLRGSAHQRIKDLAATEDVSNEWLRAQLLAALDEIARLEPVADEELERTEDF